MSDALPLAGLRVLDLSRILAGPYCCQLLADLGADVIKIERPGQGDDTRQWGPPFVAGNGPSAYYLSCNRGKRSLALDLSGEPGKAVLADLIRHSDVMIENFLPSSLEKMGLTPAQLQQLNPQLVSCSISGYGRTGPMADVPGYDLVIQAMAGIMSITGEPAGRPMKVGVAISDILCGLFAATSVLAGVYARGQGRTAPAFDLSLVDCTLASLVNVAEGALVTGKRPRRYGNAHPHIVPYESFATADGHLVLAVGNDRQYQRFCGAVGRPELASDPRFVTNPKRVEHRDALIPQIAEIISTRSTAEWLKLLIEHDVPHGPVLTLDELFQHPQIAARGMVTTPDDLPAAGPDGAGAYRLIASPVKWHGEPRRTIVHPPAVGEHSDEVLSDLGYTAERIAALRQTGIVA